MADAPSTFVPDTPSTFLPDEVETSPYDTPRTSTGAFGTRFRPTSLSTVVPVDPNKEPEIRPMSAGESLLTSLQQAPVVGKLFQPTKLPFESEQERGLEAPPKSATEAIANAARNVIGGTFKPEYIALLATPAAEAQLAKISPELATAAKQAVSSFFAYQGAKGATEQAPQIVAPGKTFPQRLQAGLETGAALGMGALGAKGVIDAKGIRSDTGQPETPGVQPVEGQGDSRPNVEPTPPEQSQPVVQGEETQKAQVAPTVTETTPPAEVPRGTSETGLRPAIRLVGGDVVVGEAGQTHPDIISRDKLKATDIDQRGFVDPQGKFLDREQAATATKLPTEKEPQRLHSTDLPEAKESPPSSALPGASPAVSAVSAATEEGGAAPSTRPAKAEPTLRSSTEQVGKSPIQDIIKPERKGGELQMTIVPGAKEFIEQDLAPKLSEAAKVIGESKDQVKAMLSPPSMGKEAEVAAGIARERKAELAQKTVQARAKFDEMRKQMDKLSKPESLTFIDNVERGVGQPSPEFQSTADNLRSEFDKRVAQVRALGTGKLEHVIQDYFPHLWKDPDAGVSWYARILGK